MVTLISMSLFFLSEHISCGYIRPLPQSSLEELAWVGLALGLDHLHVYRFKGKKKLLPGLAGNVVNIEG